MMLSLESIREVAARSGYDEISYNEESRVISFRGGPANSTRINVYYSTGTVGTCLNHPRNGKTQLFRRNVDLDALESIFHNPRVHTGGGYYNRKSIRHLWKRAGTSEYLRDSARRWVYVGGASGIVKCDREMTTIIEICTEWDDLYWERNDRPHLKETRFTCGSHGELLNMLYDVARETWGEFKIAHWNDLRQYESGEIGMDEVDCEIPFDHFCDNRAAFHEEHESDVRNLKHKFKSLRKDIRIELMQWFLARDVAGMRFTDSAFSIYETKYSSAISILHEEYGNMMYPKNAGLCEHCGVMYDTDGN